MAKLLLLRAAFAASAAVLAAGTKSNRALLSSRLLFSGMDPAEAMQDDFLDDVTAYCYKKLFPNYFGPGLDKQYEKSIHRKTIARKHDLYWCQGDSMTQAPKCEGGPELKPRDNATSACPVNRWGYQTVNCLRGYDLIQTPPLATCSTPRILYIHGGSWYSDSPWEDQYPVHTSKIAHEADAIVLSIDFPLINGWEGNGSSHKYIGDAEHVLQYALGAWEWLASHGPKGEDCKSETPPMFVAGDSSGGGSAMTLVMDLLDKERSGDLKGLPFPTGAFFESPWLNLASNSPTYYSNNFAAYPNNETALNPEKGGLFGDSWFTYFPNGDNNYTVGSPFLAVQENAKNALQYCGCRGLEWGNYDQAVPLDCINGTCGSSNTTEGQLKEWKFSPYWAPIERLHGMPPMYFATSGTELLASDTSIFAQRLGQLGGHVRAELFDGMWHTFPQWSEGCGINEDLGTENQTLWQGVTAIRHYGQFVKQVAKAAETCPGKLRASPDGNVPPPESVAVQTVHRLAGGNDGHPWVNIPPLDLDICNSPSPSFLSTGRKSKNLRAHRHEESSEEASMLQLPVEAQEDPEESRHEQLEL